MLSSQPLHISQLKLFTSVSDTTIIPKRVVRKAGMFLYETFGLFHFKFSVIIIFLHGLNTAGM